MDRRERERIMREGGAPDSPLDRAQERRLAEELEDSPLRGRPLRRRLRNFRPAVDSYVAALGGPLPYMERLREIDARVADHEARLGDAYDALAVDHSDDEGFARAWSRLVERWRFDEVNDLIVRHNRWFPAEARLPMDPRTGDYVLVRGQRYERELLDAAWVLARFPARRERAA